MNLAWGAVRLLARREIARCLRAFVLLAVVGGLVIGVAAGALVVARRTSTAHDRLAHAMHVDDARIFAIGGADPSDVTSLPMVARSWVTSYGVGRVAGPGVAFVGVAAGADAHPDLLTPVIVEGRAVDDDAVDEVILSEAAARERGVSVGDHLRLDMLTPEEVAQFDTGFGDPDGPHLDLRVVGLFRPFGTVDQNTPVLASRAFARRYGDEIAAAHMVYLRLRNGARDVPALRRAIDRLDAADRSTPGAEEFTPLDIRDTHAGDARVAATARVLAGGAVVFAVVVLVAGLLALAQALARTAAGGAAAQRIESAIGLTTFERVLARTAPAAMTAPVLVAIAVVVSAAAGAIEPLGSTRQLEPSPGAAVHIGGLVATGAVAAAVFLLLAAGAAWRAGTARQRVRATSRRPPVPIVGGAPVVAGLRFALAGDAESRGSRRSTLIGVVLGVAGMVAALTLSSSIDRLVHSPDRWGWRGDVLVLDTRAPDVAALLADRRLDAVTVFDAATADIGGRPTSVYAATPRRGAISWSTIRGELPTRSDEVTVGTRLARRADVDVGDRLTIGERRLRVVGVGLGPMLNGEALGDDALVVPDALPHVASSAPFHETLVRVAPGASVDRVTAELAATHEIQRREPPPDVQDLHELGRLPALLAAVLVAIATLALAHALAVTGRRRARPRRAPLDRADRAPDRHRDRRRRAGDRRHRHGRRHPARTRARPRALVGDRRRRRGGDGRQPAGRRPRGAARRRARGRHGHRTGGRASRDRRSSGDRAANGVTVSRSAGAPPTGTAAGSGSTSPCARTSRRHTTVRPSAGHRLRTTSTGRRPSRGDGPRCGASPRRRRCPAG